jgi:hypothetical protein
MASIIIPSNFYGDLTIAQVGNTSVQGDIQKYIDKFEQEYLLNLLGYELKKRFDANGADDIKNGKEYTSRFSNLLAKWIGLTFVNSASPIASYIYCKYQLDQQTKSTPVGEKKLQAQNSNNSNANDKITRQWNWMVDRNRELVDFLMSDQENYPEFVRWFYSYEWIDKGLPLVTYTHNIF